MCRIVNLMLILFGNFFKKWMVLSGQRVLLCLLQLWEHLFRKVICEYILSVIWVTTNLGTRGVRCQCIFTVKIYLWLNWAELFVFKSEINFRLTNRSIIEPDWTLVTAKESEELYLRLSTKLCTPHLRLESCHIWPLSCYVHYTFTLPH